MALFAYPVLQALGVFLHKCNLVPVGEYQLQQIHLCQHLAARFNNCVQVFPHPAVRVTDSCTRMKSLRQPDKKMSKSDGDEWRRIEILDSDEEIVKKVKKAKRRQ